jgi:hypothetical protein
MDTWDLLILGVLAVPICAIAALVMAVGARSRLRLLEYRMARLEVRLFRLVGSVDEARPAEVQPEPVMPEPAEPEPAEPAEPEPLPPEEAAIEAAKAATPPISLEERFGTQWVVWVGGLALALGGFFLVRYSIEQGWFGPAMRAACAYAACRRRMDAAKRDPYRNYRSSCGLYPRCAYGGRYCHCIRRRLCSLRALRTYRASHRLPTPWCGRARNACGCTGAWSGPCRPRTCRRLSNTAHRLD